MRSEVTSVKEQRAVEWVGSATSSIVAIDGLRDLAVFLPTGFVGTSLTFLASHDDVTFAGVNTGGSAVTTNITANKWNVLPAALAAFKSIKLVSSSSETISGAIVQGAS